MRIPVLAIVVLALFAFSSSGHVEASPGITTRVSVAGDEMEGNSSSLFSSISGDGRYVAFISQASNLVPNDTNGHVDVFVRDREFGLTERASVSSGYAQGNADSTFEFEAPAISADGRYVAFSSAASNLVPGDTNNFCDFNGTAPCADIFVRDRYAGTTERVSVDSGGNQAFSNSFNPAISADGRFVTFWSYAWNLVAGDDQLCYFSVGGFWYNCGDVFVHDRETGATSRVSVAAGQQANGDSWAPAISADGRFVAFQSNASNLVAEGDPMCSLDGSPASCTDVFLHDRQTGATSRVSVASAGTEANSNSVAPAISGDGRFVSFSSMADNLVPGDTNEDIDTFVHDRQTGATERANVDSLGNQANSGVGYSNAPPAPLTADGRFVAFESAASNLVDNDSCVPGVDFFCSDIFVHDRQAGETIRVSVDSASGEANRDSHNPAISADGRFIAFESYASNLVVGDTNGGWDVFVHDLGDSDSDAVPDPFDNCPAIANADQKDNDSDGAGDACDDDDDNDTILDGADNCPATPNADQGDADGDLAGDACDGAGTGNVDCSPPPTGVNSVDALKVLRHSAALSVTQNEPCLNIGQSRLPPAVNWKVGDVDCSGVVNAVDALKILRAVAGLSVIKPAECPDIKPPL
jgi:Tol biopolymer transport system component